MMHRRMLPSPRELIEYESPDGAVYQLHVPHNSARWVISQDGWGMPLVEYVTTRGPAQHGESIIDLFLRPRVIQALVRQNYCSRDDLWAGRSKLIDAIRPNRQIVSTGSTPGTLRMTLPDGSKRCLSVFIESGPKFEPRVNGRWDEWSFQEMLRFIAHDPVIYDPTLNTHDFTPNTELVFPITFPITFGALDSAYNLTYTGTWVEYPVFVLNGPMSSPRIENETTGETIQINYNIPPGDSLTIALAYGAKTVVDSSGTNRIGTISSDSDLASFHLAPDPEAPGGVNVIHIHADGVNAATLAQIQWFTRYIGI